MPVFVSHSQEDEGLYSAVCYALDLAHIERLDVGRLVPGISLADQLRTVIQRCEVCIFLATRRSIKSRWCLAELGAFWGAGKGTILYHSDPELTEAEIPPQFQGNLRTTNAQQLVSAVNDALKASTWGPLPVDLLPVEHLQALANDASSHYDHIRLACAHTLWAFRPDRAKPVLENQLGDWCAAVARLTSATTIHMLLMDGAAMTGTTASAHDSMVVLREALMLQPRSINAPESQPPKMLPALEAVYTTMVGIAIWSKLRPKVSCRYLGNQKR